MPLSSVGQLIAEHRRRKGLTLRELASAARVGRSTLAALEAGKVPELGFTKVERICVALDLVVDARPLSLDAPVMPHRHLTERAGRDLTKAAIEDVIVRGDVTAWRRLVGAIRKDKTGRLLRRARDLAAALAHHDEKARAFEILLPKALGKAIRAR